MDNNSESFGLSLEVIKWLARIGSLISIGLLCLFMTGEDGLHPSRITPREWVGLFFFPFGVMAGMILAWWKEGLGSLITVGSLLGFYVVYGFLLQSRVGGWFIVFASPGFLFLMHWLLSETKARHALT